MQPKPDKKVRTAKLGSVIKRRLAEVLPDFLGDTTHIVTVNKVEVSEDTKYAKVWISILGIDGPKTIERLEKNIYDIQGELNRHLKLRMTPKIHFIEDTGPEYAQKIEELIRDIKDLKKEE